jgi:3-dehydroquinate dehydratase-2
MRVDIINGPNLNLLGQREPEIYGRRTLGDIESSLNELAEELGLEVTFFQTNSEGAMVDALQRAGREADGVILNAAAYTHTSVAMRDAVSAISVPVVEVHLSDPRGREEFRKVSFLSGVCAGSICGFGDESYSLALIWFARRARVGVAESLDA